MTARPLFRLHPVQHGVAGDAGIVDQHVDRTEIGLDLLHPVDAGLVRRNVPLVDRDAGFGLEFLRRLVVAGIIGRDPVAGGVQGLADRRADPSCPPVTNATRGMIPPYGFWHAGYCAGRQSLSLVTLEPCMAGTSLLSASRGIFCNAAFSPSSRLFDLNGAIKTASTKHSSAIMVR